MAATYLVTGGAGFIGRHLCSELLRQGHRVRVLDNLIEQVHGGAALPAEIASDVEFVSGDVRDADALARALAGVDGVFHLAAEVGVGQSMYEIDRYVSANDLGTAVLLQQLIRAPVDRIVVASSMSVYGEGLYRTAGGRVAEQVRRDGESVKAGRWDPVGPAGEALTPVATPEGKRPDLASIYALTKYAQEQQTLIVGGAYGMGAVALRLFNVFGPGQALSNPYTGVLAIFASRLLNDERPLVFEDGRQQRDFVHVKDVARAFRLAMETPEANGATVNIGSGRRYAILEVGRRLADAMGKPRLDPEILNKARAGDIRHCFADIGLAEKLLGFRPRHALEDSLGELADWVARCKAVDRVAEARRELETRGLVV